MKVFHNALTELTDVCRSIENLKDSNQVFIQDAKLQISSIEEAIEKKATAQSMLQTEFEETKESISKIKEILNVR